MRLSVVATAVSLSLVGLSLAADADAAIKRSTNIPPQALAPALRSLAKERDFQIVFASQDVSQLRTGGASGELTAIEALEQLLSGTGLAYKYIDDKTITILREGKESDARAQPAPSAAARGPAIGAPGHSATQATPPNAKEAQKKSFWERFRLAQVDPRQPASGAGSVTSAEQSSDGGSRLQIEEVVVTAQKRKERLIDVPQAVSVLSADTLEKLGATQFRDFASTIPGLTFTTSGAGFTQISLRGVTSGVPDTSATVGIYVDETPYGTSNAFTNGARLTLDSSLFDLDRIEVLRGPQGTLYGASTMGGLIKYVSKRPDAGRFGGDVQAGVSGTQDGGLSYNVAGVVNAPIVTDKGAVRVGGFYTRDGGYIDSVSFGDDVNRSRTYGGRADLLLTPTDAISVRLTAFIQNIAREGEGTANFTTAGVPVDGSLKQDRALPEPFDQHFRLASGTITYQLGPVSLTSISSYQKIGTRFDYDLSSVFVPFLSTPARPIGAVGLPGDTDTEKFTQEVRVSGEGTKPLEWVVGGFYNHESADYLEGFSLRSPSGQVETNDLYTLHLPSRFEEYAAFGDVTWHLTDRFNVTGGTRYAHNEQSFTQTLSGIFGASTETSRSSEDVSTYLANVRYRFSDNATAYARFATGYRPGGPNLAANDPVSGLPLAPRTFAADRLKSYEIGYKSETTDGRVGIDVATYYIDWSNLQLLATRGGFGVRLNAPGGASIRGAELTLTLRPVRPLTLSSAFAYQDAKLSEANADLGGADGERLPNVPRFTGAVNADYELPVQSGQPTVGATLRHVSDRKADFGSTAYRLPEYTIVDLRAGFTLQQIQMQLYVHNLFDERAQLSADTGFGIRTAISQPRTIGISATTRF